MDIKDVHFLGISQACKLLKGQSGIRKAKKKNLA